MNIKVAITIHTHTHTHAAIYIFWHLLYTQTGRRTEKESDPHNLALDMYPKDTHCAEFLPRCNAKHLFDGQLEICLPFAIRFSHLLFPQQ